MAKETNGQSKLSTATVAGTSRYLPPEIQDGEKQSSSGDIWALGVVLLELAYGRDSFKESQIMSLNPKRLRKIFKKSGRYSLEMSIFISRCFENTSKSRPTVIELLKDKYIEGMQ